MTVRILRQASRYRDEGRFEEAADLVETGLRLDPDNLVGLLLAGSLHTVFREMHLAKTAFARVLSIDRAHPRALLGLARIALEEAKPGTCTELLQRVIAADPDPARMERDMAGIHPMNRMGEASEIGSVASFLLSADASFVSGQCIAVDGAATARCYALPVDPALAEAYGLQRRS